MKVSFSSRLGSATALFVFIPEQKWNKRIFTTLLPKNLEKQIVNHYSSRDFTGKFGEVLQLFPAPKEFSKVFLVGTGKGKKKHDVRRAAGVAVRRSKSFKLKKLAFLVPETIDPLRIASGCILGNYEFKIGDRKEFFSPESVTIVSKTPPSKGETVSEIALAEATNLTRDLINLPPNMMTPKILAEEAKKIGKKGPVRVRVMGEKDLQKMKMGSMFGVGQGSHEESQLIVFEYNGGKKSEAPTAFVGKGVCFDSGGYNLKPTGHIEEMKSDMSGAANVLGFFRWVAEARPKRNIIGVVGAVENLVSGNAFKPGDILTAMNGQTIEITNTDAEGRLVLADCLHYTATKFKPAQMFDAATLTGAVIAALGYEITGIMGNTPSLVTKVKKAAEMADEEVWDLPLTDYFREKIKGEVSDLVNWTAGVSAGSPMAGAFLENFVGKTPWVHFDIAGTAFHGKSGDEITPKGATGVMLRTYRALMESVL